VKARARQNSLAVDPHAAFCARMRRDRRKLIELSSPLRGPMRWARAAARVAAIEQLAHGLAGAAGVFGFAALGEDAARLERQLERWRLHPPAVISRQRRAAFARNLAPLLARLRDASAK
jgi:HPt (histidine-containing phosphotransfer) domain-containing protein